MFEFVKKLIFGVGVTLSPVAELEIQDGSLIQNTVSISLVDGLDKLEILQESEKILDQEDKGYTAKLYEILRTKQDPFVVLDIGAEVGNFCLLAKYFPASKWYAVESKAEKLSLLKRNIELNRLVQVDCFKLAVLKESEEFAYLPKCSDESGLVEQNERILAQEVDAVSVDQFCQDQKIEHVDFIKIKAAGSELKILLGANQCLTKQRPLIFVDLSHYHAKQYGFTIKEIKKVLKRCGYKTRSLGIRRWVFMPQDHILGLSLQESTSKESAL